MITITRPPPHLTVQDNGRKHSRSFGVPLAGAMDVFALRAANALVGNSPDLAALEWALGGGSIRFETDCAFAIAGARARAMIGGEVVAPFTTNYAVAGDELSIENLTAGRFLYIALSGGIDVPVVLGSRSTYLPGRFGGHEGRLLRRNDALGLGDRPASLPARGFVCPADLLPRYESGVVHITRGTHANLFDESSWLTFTESEYTISTASDRTGYKLKGEALLSSPGALASEGGCPGVVQIPGDGAPIVLMADAPTVGGYPKIAVVSESDLPILAQRAPGESIRFQVTTIEQSQRALRRRAADLHSISQLANRSAG
jgi:antagonist of KipI